MHREYEKLFHAISKDREHRVVILTGCGEDFSGPEASRVGCNHIGSRTPDEWDQFRTGGKDLLMNLVNIEVPAIAALNGPARRHAEIPLLSDIVIASDTALFQDSAHFVNDVVARIRPGASLPLHGREIHAKEALDLGIVAEIVPKDAVLDRAWELARHLAKRRDVVIRNTRLALTQLLKAQLLDSLEYGLGLEALAAIHAEEH